MANGNNESGIDMKDGPTMEREAQPQAMERTKPGEVPAAVAKRGIDFAAWNTLCNSLFPGANPNSVVLVLDYCKARGLDPMKKPCHIVPMDVKNSRTGEYEKRDVVMPGIYEHRTTAQRTGEYLGHTAPEYGPEIEHMGVKAPEWCAMTFFRWNSVAKEKVPFPVKVFFREVVATTWDKKTGRLVVNSRWTRAPIQMMTKCCEAAGLREGWPEELGGEQTAEEMEGRFETAKPVDGKVVAGGGNVEDELLSGLPADEQAEVATLFTQAKLNQGQISTLLKKHANDLKGLKAALQVVPVEGEVVEKKKEDDKPKEPPLPKGVTRGVKVKDEKPADPVSQPELPVDAPAADAVFKGGSRVGKSEPNPDTF
jgi:phage recombination protein Bet